ncbi:hypothetical protein OG590_40095 (plasmid) [Streptomyces goshikiensis]|uniref:hypothetical protein n=1 Tax=Streptomyces goshikiensis TaxID=1942 RepID=UPI002F915720|nr:hypothetical protein OG590_40095 [Streptomyces goshikiensis]
MTMISAGDLDRVVTEARAYQHLHLTGASADRFNRLVLTFRPFTGAEAEPERPLYAWKDESLTPESRAFIDAQYDEAILLWRTAAYAAALKDAAKGAGPQWDAYARALAVMEEIFTSLDTTPDTHWRATVSQLVTAQKAALDAAITWDHTGRAIATVHDNFRHGAFSRAEMYEAVGIDASQWVIGDTYAYEAFRGGPVAREAQKRIDVQRKHLRTVASLSGDRDPA